MEKPFIDQNAKFIVSFQNIVEMCGGNNVLAKTYAMEFRPHVTWRPIETWKKNRDSILVFGMVINDDEPREPVCCEAAWDPNLEKFIRFDEIQNDEIIPTHWMPLPEPPTASPEA